MIRRPHEQLVVRTAGRNGRARSMRMRASSPVGCSPRRSRSGQPALARSLTTMWYSSTSCRPRAARWVASRCVCASSSGIVARAPPRSRARVSMSMPPSLSTRPASVKEGWRRANGTARDCARAGRRRGGRREPPRSAVGRPRAPVPCGRSRRARPRSASARRPGRRGKRGSAVARRSATSASRSARDTSGTSPSRTPRGCHTASYQTSVPPSRSIDRAARRASWRSRATTRSAVPSATSGA